MPPRRFDRCIHGEQFPCAECQAVRARNAAEGRHFTDDSFEILFREIPPIEPCPHCGGRLIEMPDGHNGWLCTKCKERICGGAQGSMEDAYKELADAMERLPDGLTRTVIWKARNEISGLRKERDDLSAKVKELEETIAELRIAASYANYD